MVSQYKILTTTKSEMSEKEKTSNSSNASWDHPAFMAFVIIMLILGATFLFVSAGYINDSRGLIDDADKRPLDRAFLKRHANVILGLVIATGIGLVVAFITTTALAAQKRHPKEVDKLKKKIEEVITPREKEKHAVSSDEDESSDEEAAPVRMPAKTPTPRPVPTRPAVRSPVPTRRGAPTVNLK